MSDRTPRAETDALMAVLDRDQAEARRILARLDQHDRNQLGDALDELAELIDAVEAGQ